MAFGRSLQLLAGLLILLAAAAAHAQPPRELTDQDLVDYVMRPGSVQLPHDGDILGVLHGVTVRLDHGMSDMGPSWEILWLDPPAGESCANAGGVMRSRVVNKGWFHRSKMFCTPKAVADAEDRELKEAQRRATTDLHLERPPTTSQPPTAKSGAGQGAPP